MSAFCLSGHLSACLSPDMYVLDFFLTFECGQKYTEIKAHIWKNFQLFWKVLSLKFVRDDFK